MGAPSVVMALMLGTATGVAPIPSGTVKPFLLLATRADDDVADQEYESFARFGGLEPGQLRRVRLEAGPMPAIDLDGYSGIVVGGSPFNASDPAHLKPALQRRVEREMHELLDGVVECDFPFFGACYGVGTLGAHQGAVIDRTYGEPVGPVPISLTEAGRADPLLEGLSDVFDAFVGHKEACRTLPAHATLLASSPLCPVQLFRIRSNLYATQFHPELDEAATVRRIETYRHAGYFAPEEMDEVIERVRAASVTEPPRILENFVRRYAR